GAPRTVRVAEDHPREPETRKGRYRKQQEELVLDAHDSGRVRGLIVRLSDFYVPGADIGLANPIFRTALAGKTANWFGPVNPAHEFLFVPDADPVIVELGRTRGSRVDLSGAPLFGVSRSSPLHFYKSSAILPVEAKGNQCPHASTSPKAPSTCS